MNLFKTLSDILSSDSDVTIVVRKTGDDTLVVSTAVRNHKTEDPAREAIAPFVVSGSADELDAEYASLIKAPMEKSSGIQTSMANFEASAKAAQAASKAAAEKKRAADDAKKTAKTAVAKILGEADTLLKAKKYAEAKARYSKALQEAEKAGLSAEKSAAQKGIDTCSKKETPDIFGAFGDEGKAQETAPAEETEEESPEEPEEPVDEEEPEEPADEEPEEEEPAAPSALDFDNE
jgi:PRTRC genetic system protein E